MEDNNKQTNGNGEGKIRKVLFNEVTFFIAICSVVLGVALFITRPDTQMQQDIALIQKDIYLINTNHLTTVENNAQRLKEIQADVDKLEDKTAELDRKLIKIMVKLGIEE